MIRYKKQIVWMLLCSVTLGSIASEKRTKQVVRTGATEAGPVLSREQKIFEETLVKKRFTKKEELASEKLCEAAFSGNLKVVQEVVEGAFGKIVINSPYMLTAITPLLGAIGNGHLAVVKYLVEKDANLVLQNNQGQYALALALKNGQTEIYKFLTEIIKKSVGKEGVTVSAPVVTQTAPVRETVAAPVVTQTAPGEYSPAAVLGDISTLSKAKLQAKIREREQVLLQPLMVVDRPFFIEQIRLLKAQLAVVEDEEAEKQAQAEEAQAQSAAARQQAAQELAKDKAQTIEAQRKLEADQQQYIDEHKRLFEETLVKKGFTKEEELASEKLCEAAFSGDLQVVREVLAGQYVRKVINSPYMLTATTPLLAATENGHLEVVKYLIGEGAALSLQNSEGQSATTLARARGKTEIADFLTEFIEKARDLRESISAVMAKFIEDISRMSKAELEAEIVQKEQELKKPATTAVDLANKRVVFEPQIRALRDQLKVVEDKEAVAKAKEEEAQAQSAAASQQAAQKEEEADTKLVQAQKELQVSQQELKARASKRFTEAVEHARVTLSQAVIDKNLQGIKNVVDGSFGKMVINSRYSLEWTPLLIAVNEKYLEGVEYLVDHDADLTLTNTKGQDALTLARELKATDIVEFLEDFLVRSKMQTNGQALDYLVAKYSEVPKSKEILSKAFQILNMSPLSAVKMSNESHSAYMKQVRSDSKNKTAQAQAAIAIVTFCIRDLEAPRYADDDADLTDDEIFEKYGKILESWTPVVTIPVTEPSSFLQTQMSIAQQLLSQDVSQVSFANLAQLSHGVQVTPGFMGSVQVCLWNLNKMPVRGNIRNIIDVVRKVRLAKVS